MTKLNRLKKEATEATDFRGHSLGRWNSADSYTKSESAWNFCGSCGAFVAVNTKPFPNDIEIGGDALALTCTSTTVRVLKKTK